MFPMNGMGGYGQMGGQNPQRFQQMQQMPQMGQQQFGQSPFAQMLGQQGPMNQMQGKFNPGGLMSAILPYLQQRNSGIAGGQNRSLPGFLGGMGNAR